MLCCISHVLKGFEHAFQKLSEHLLDINVH